MRYSLFLLVLALLGACTHKADENAGLNQKPLATVSVKDVTLADSSNLVSTVHVYWTGSDADGFIKGFKIAIDSGAYQPVQLKTDSLFRFTLSAGNTQQNIVFKVVAIDNQGVESAPARLILPVRNLPPVALFNASFMPRLDTALGVLSIPFIASDPDGDETLDSVFLRVNGGPWYPMAPRTASVTLIAQDPRQNGTQPARVYSAPKLNADITLQPRLLQGFVVGGANLFELKARDLAEAESPIAQILLADGTPRSFYVRPITSDLLVLDAYTVGVPTPESIYYPVLNAAYPQGWDRLDMTYQNGRNQQPLFTATMTTLLGQYKKVFWYSDAARLSSSGIRINRIDTSSLLVETISPILANYIGQAGTHVLMSASLPQGTQRLSSSSPLFALLPVDSISYLSNRQQLRRNQVVTSNAANYGNLRTLTLAQGGLTVNPTTFFPSAQTDSLYTAPITVPGSSPMTRAIGGRYPKGSSSPSLIFFTHDLHQLAGDTSAAQTKPEFTQFFQNVLTRDFN